jgi:Protein of unknown function (DUF3574)
MAIDFISRAPARRLRSGARLVATLAVLTFLSACQVPRSPVADLDCSALRGQPSLSVLLYFGRDRDGEEAPKPGGTTPIPEAEWRQFLQDEVTPRFPEGFTVIDSYGQWRNPQTQIVTRQRSAVVNIVAPNTPEALRKLDDLADRYKRKFHQISVGISLAPVCAGF